MGTAVAGAVGYAVRFQRREKGVTQGQALWLAGQLGISVHARDDVPWLVGSAGSVVVYSWHPDVSVRAGRICEGIAQCLLTRMGVAWSTAEAAELGSRLHVNRHYH